MLDMILAVGGGSVMDCCKAVSLAARYDGDIWEDFWTRPGVIDFEPLPLGVDCHGGGHRQRVQRRRRHYQRGERKSRPGGIIPQLNPRFALMDPTYTFSVPKRQMVSGSFDILSHIMETYFSAPRRGQRFRRHHGSADEKRHPQSACSHAEPKGCIPPAPI